MPTFDYAAARAAGMSDDDIGAYIQSQRDAGVDLYIQKSNYDAGSRPQPRKATAQAGPPTPQQPSALQQGLSDVGQAAVGTFKQINSQMYKGAAAVAGGFAPNPNQIAYPAAQAAKKWLEGLGEQAAPTAKEAAATQKPGVAQLGVGLGAVPSAVETFAGGPAWAAILTAIQNGDKPWYQILPQASTNGLLAAVPGLTAGKNAVSRIGANAAAGYAAAKAQGASEAQALAQAAGLGIVGGAHAEAPIKEGPPVPKSIVDRTAPAEEPVAAKPAGPTPHEQFRLLNKTARAQALKTVAANSQADFQTQLDAYDSLIGDALKRNDRDGAKILLAQRNNYEASGPAPVNPASSEVFAEQRANLDRLRLQAKMAGLGAALEDNSGAAAKGGAAKLTNAAVAPSEGVNESLTDGNPFGNVGLGKKPENPVPETTFGTYGDVIPNKLADSPALMSFHDQFMQRANMQSFIKRMTSYVLEPIDRVLNTADLRNDFGKLAIDERSYAVDQANANRMAANPKAQVVNNYPKLDPAEKSRILSNPKILQAMQIWRDRGYPFLEEMSNRAGVDVASRQDTPNDFFFPMQATDDNGNPMYGPGGAGWRSGTTEALSGATMRAGKAKSLSLDYHDMVSSGLLSRVGAATKNGLNDAAIQTGRMLMPGERAPETINVDGHEIPATVREFKFIEPQIKVDANGSPLLDAEGNAQQGSKTVRYVIPKLVDKMIDRAFLPDEPLPDGLLQKATRGLTKVTLATGGEAVGHMISQAGSLSTAANVGSLSGPVGKTIGAVGNLLPPLKPIAAMMDVWNADPSKALAEMAPYYNTRADFLTGPLSAEELPPTTVAGKVGAATKNVLKTATKVVFGPSGSGPRSFMGMNERVPVALWQLIGQEHPEWTPHQKAIALYNTLPNYNPKLQGAAVKSLRTGIGGAALDPFASTGLASIKTAFRANMGLSPTGFKPSTVVAFSTPAAIASWYAANTLLDPKGRSPITRHIPLGFICVGEDPATHRQVLADARALWPTFMRVSQHLGFKQMTSAYERGERDPYKIAQQGAVGIVDGFLGRSAPWMKFGLTAATGTVPYVSLDNRGKLSAFKIAKPVDRLGIGPASIPVHNKNAQQLVGNLQQAFRGLNATSDAIGQSAGQYKADPKQELHGKWRTAQLLGEMFGVKFKPGDIIYRDAPQTGGNP